MTKKKEEFVTVTLSQPIERGEKSITSVTLRKPNAGELRGTKIMDLVMADVNSLVTVLPRISDPALSEADIGTMDISDIAAMGFEVSSFLEQKKSSK